MPDKPKSGVAPLRKPRLTDWSRPFLAELAATSNVSAAARKAGICTSTAYEARRQSAEFNRAWQQALCEGYDLLELELLRRLREGEVKPAAGARRGVRTYDNATALRLLAAYRESTARFRAVRTREESDAIVRSINAKLEKMRERRLAAGDRE
jgi:hypothetical protein